MNKLYAHLGGLMQEKKTSRGKELMSDAEKNHNKEQKLIIMID